MGEAIKKLADCGARSPVPFHRPVKDSIEHDISRVQRLTVMGGKAV